MPQLHQLPRQCLASSSRHTLLHPPYSPLRPLTRPFSLLPDRQPFQPVPFFTPPFLPLAQSGHSSNRPPDKEPNGHPNMGPSNETEVDDGEWEIRAGELGAHHIQQWLELTRHPKLEPCYISKTPFHGSSILGRRLQICFRQRYSAKI